MRLPYSNIKRRRVETVSGTELGRIRDLIIDPDAHTIIHYVVSPLPIGGHALLISPADIVTIETHRIVVKDATLANKNASHGNARMMPPEPIPMQRQHDGG